MAYFGRIGEVYPSLVDGWTPLPSGPTNYWEQTLAGGFWYTNFEYLIDDVLSGVGDIIGRYLSIGSISVAGSVCGVGAVYADCTIPEVTRVTGTVAGMGVVDSKYNCGRQRAAYPEIRFNRDGLIYRDCPIAALEFKGFSPNKIINIIPHSDDIYENTEEFFTVEELEKTTSGNFPLEHYSFDNVYSSNINYLVTNLTTEKQEKVPLFYQYELLYDAWIQEDGDPITIYKNNETIVDKNKYSIQYSYDLVDTNSRYSTTDWGPINLSGRIHRLRILLPYSANNPNDFYIVSYKKHIYGAVTDQRELISLVSLYDESDFTVTSSGVVLTPSSRISSSTNTIYISKDPRERIFPMGIYPPTFQSDEVMSWSMCLNPGTAFIPSGEFSGTPAKAYKLTNKYIEETPIAVTYVRPLFISDDVIGVRQTPMELDLSEFVYPTYTIGMYDRADLDLVTTDGKIAISVNGASVPGLKILSIDKEKGFIQVNKILNTTDEVELDYYLDQSGHIIVRNFELNPKVDSSSELHMTGFMSGACLALRPYSSSDPSTEFVYVYDPNIDESIRNCYKIPVVGQPTEAIPWDNDFFTICELNINRLTKDVVKITDARKITDVETLELNKALQTTQVSGLNPHEIDWYSNTGYYAGEPLSFGGAVVINIPSGAFFGARNQWISYYESEGLDGREAVERGTKEFNFYLDQVIKRYVSAGTDYLIIPVDSSGNFMDIVRLMY